MHIEKYEIEILRKDNFKRGFKAGAMITVVVLVTAFVVWANIYISLNS